MKATGRALLGVALCAVAALAYFGWWAKQPGFGSYDWPVWCVELAGLAIAGRAALRPPPGTLRADRFIAVLCFALAIGVAGLFGQFTSAESYRLPAADGSRLEVGRALPDVAVTRSDGAPFSLAREQQQGALAGRQIVLLFFRGFW